MSKIGIIAFGAIAVLLMLLAAEPERGLAGHRDNSNPWLWEWFFSYWPASSRTVLWEPCGDLTNLGENIDSAAEDWDATHGYGINHYTSWNCDDGGELPVWGVSSADPYCGSVNACTVPTSYVWDGQGRAHVYAAVIYVEAPTVRTWSEGRQTHAFAHEMGHYMALEDHSSCGPVMSPQNCTDGVDPPDVVVPRCEYGYTC